jgi:hypothetical protein
MNKIKFSHKYLKLESCYNDKGFLENRLEALLLQVIKINKMDLSEVFINYDTIYKVKHNIEYFENYDLPDGTLILLIFSSPEKGLFTTLRRFTKAKYDYYKGLEGNRFIVEIKRV